MGANLKRVQNLRRITKVLKIEFVKCAALNRKKI